jgi:hypothetical protein
MLAGSEVEEAVRFQYVYAGLSINDLYALVLAKSLAYPIATGDHRLRAATEQECIMRNCSSARRQRRAGTAIRSALPPETRRFGVERRKSRLMFTDRTGLLTTMEP